MTDETVSLILHYRSGI